MDRAKIGVAGLGRFGVWHARVLAQLPQVELAAVCSRSEERAREVAETYGARKWYTDYVEMVQDAEIEAVDVVSDLDRHGEIALAALQNGKHVFSEILLTMRIPIRACIRRGHSSLYLTIVRSSRALVCAASRWVCPSR